MADEQHSTMNLVVKTYEHGGMAFEVPFTDEAFFNATIAAKTFCKKANDWLRLDSTKEYIDAMIETGICSVSGNPVTSQNQIVRIIQGGSNPTLQGTWLHHKLAIPYARWLNVKFSLWCDQQIDAIIHSKPVVELTREQILVMALESERKAIELAKKLEEAKPMIDFHEEVTEGVGEFTIPKACKILFNAAVTADQLRHWLKTNNWMDKRKGFNEPTMWALRQGYMRQRISVKIRPGIVVDIPMITTKGFTLLRHLYRTGELFVSTIPMDRRITAPDYPV